jgi:HAD superfamily hydrolase (TIGR01509 family)
MSLDPPFSAVCFDLDGTLIDTEPLHLQAELNTLRFLGVEQRADDHPRTFGMGIMPSMSAISDHYGLGSAQRVFDAYLPFWEKVVESDLELKPGARDLLGVISRRSIPMALVTSGDREYVDLVIRLQKLESIFDCIVTEDDVASLKPDPEPYLAAARCLGRAPEKCLGVEDSGSGVASLRAASMYVVAVHPEASSRPELSGADERFASLRDIGTEIVSRWFGDDGRHA